MKAVNFLGNSRIDICEAPRPEADESTVLLRVMATGLCGSELHSFKGPAHEKEGFSNSGHEVAGVIEEAPDGSSFEPGMRVGARVVQGCGNCHWCKQGYETACENKHMYAGNGHAEYYRLGIQGIHPIPDDAEWPAAVLLTGDGLGVPVRAARRLGDTAGKKVLVLGLGPVGLSSVLVQASRGAEVMGADLFEYRRNLAVEIGAARAADASDFGELKQSVLDWTNGFGADIVILAVGRDEVFLNAIELVARQGTVYQIGELSELTLNPSSVFIKKEINITGSWYYTSSDWPEMLALHENGVPYHKLITHVFPFEQAQEAFDTFVSGNSGKVVLTYQ